VTEDSVLRIVLRFGLDQPTATDAKAGVDSVTAAIKQTQAQAVSATAEMRQLRAAGRELRQVGFEIGLVGAAIGGPLIAAAKSFVDANQKTSYIARQWLTDTNNTAASYQRIGGVVARDMLPAMDQASKLVDKLATFAEQNPGLVKMALGASGTLVGAGAGLVVLGQATQTVANIGLLMVALNKMPAIAAAGGVSGILGSTAVVGSVGAGAAVAGGMATGYGLTALLGVQAANGGSEMARVFQAATEALRMVVNKITGMNYQIEGRNARGGVGSAPYGPQQPQEPMYSGGAQRTYDQTTADRAAGTLWNERQAAQPVYNAYTAASSANLDTFTTQQSDTRMAYLKSSLQAEATFQDSRSKMIRDFGEQATQAETTYNRSRLLAIRNFNEQAAQAAESFNDSQGKALDAHNLEMTRLAQDFAISQAAALGTHNQTLRDFVASGDVLGFAKEQERFATSNAAAIAANKTEVDRKNADFATSSADAKKAYDEQRAQNAANFQQSQDDAAQAYQDQRTQAKFNFDQALGDAQAAFNDQQRQAGANFKTTLDAQLAAYTAQQTQLTTAFTAQLNAIDPILTGMTTLVQKKGQAASDEFGKFLDGLQSQVGGGPGYCGSGYHWDATTKACVIDAPIHYGSAAGGYVGYGMRLLGEQGKEFVLSNPTVSAAERLTGGPLSQAAVLNALGGGHTVNLGGITVGQGGTLRQVLDAVDAKITSAFEQLGEEMA
jgi:hypothetical protein